MRIEGPKPDPGNYLKKQGQKLEFCKQRLVDKTAVLFDFRQQISEMGKRDREIRIVTTTFKNYSLSGEYFA